MESSSEAVESVVTGIINSSQRSAFNKFIFKQLPIEFRLLLSPDKDIASPVLFPRIFELEAMMLVGRERRFSRSTSDRSGRFGVN